MRRTYPDEIEIGKSPWKTKGQPPRHHDTKIRKKNYGQCGKAYGYDLKFSLRQKIYFKKNLK